MVCRGDGWGLGRERGGEEEHKGEKKTIKDEFDRKEEDMKNTPKKKKEESFDSLFRTELIFFSSWI